MTRNSGSGLGKMSLSRMRVLVLKRMMIITDNIDDSV